MRFKFKMSLRAALWLVIAIATIPALALAFADYQSNRQQALRNVTDDVRTMLITAQAAEQLAINEVHLLLRIMATANEMQTPDPLACHGLAGRLLKSAAHLSNIGAVAPDGKVICSGIPMTGVVSVADRPWFKNALTGTGFGVAQFLVGRISRQPGVTFPYVMRDAEGQIERVLFASSQPNWLDYLVKNYQLREGWEATLITREGKIITHYPDPERWRLHQVEPTVFAAFEAALQQPGFIGELKGFDGLPRMYGLAPLVATSGEIWVLIGAPVERSLARVNRDGLEHLAILLLVTLFSALFARGFIYRLIEASTQTLRRAVRQLAAGQLETRVSGLEAAEEFAVLGDGFNAMAAALQMREAELQRLSQAIEQSPESIVIADLNAKIIYANQAFSKISGYPLAEVIGQNPSFLQSGDTPKGTYDDLWATLSSGRPWRGKFKNKRKDGSLYDELATISPIIGADGQTTHFVAVKQDITEQKRLASELDAHRHHLEKLVQTRTYELTVAKEAADVANKAKSSFLANMSHEIRTPLNAILGLGHLLAQSPLTPEQCDKVDKIAAAGKHLLQVINDILDLAKIEAGKVELQIEDFNPSAVLQEVATLISSSADKKGLSIHLDTHSLPPRVSGDATRLRQSLLNLAGNAIKFTDQGSVTLRGQVVNKDRVSYLLRFSVEDTGPGIAPSKLPLLFNAFEQLDSSTSRVHGGTGLGLAITRHLVRLMGGEVGAESQLGQGSCFWLTIRVDRSNSGPEASYVDAGLSAAEQLNRRLLPVQILLAEDDPLNAEVAVEILTSVGCQVDVAVDGEKAAKMAASRNYELILMDIQMPVMNGLEATDLIRAQPQHKKTPILAMTANVMLDDKRKYLKHGMNDFIPKPFDPEQLFATVLRWLPESESKVVPAAAAESAYQPLSEEALVQAMQDLAVALASGDLESNRLFFALETHLIQRYGLALAPLKNAIAEYDYELASRQLSKLRGEP